MSLTSFKPPYKMRTICLMLVIGFIMLFSQACSQGQGPSLALYPTQIPPTQVPVEIDPLSTVTFQVDIPADTPANQPILLSLLDEVTGLGLKISRREMQKVGESTYSITLPFPVGANIKYRYARQDSYIAEEHNTNHRVQDKKLLLILNSSNEGK